MLRETDIRLSSIAPHSQIVPATFSNALPDSWNNKRQEKQETVETVEDNADKIRPLCQQHQYHTRPTELDFRRTWRGQRKSSMDTLWHGPDHEVSLRHRPDHHVQPKSACATGQTITSSQSQQPVCHVSFTRKPDHRIIRGYLTECSANVRYDKYQLDCGLVYVMSASASDQTMTPVVTTASITISHAITSCHVSQH